MLTLEEFSEIPAGNVFAKGEIIDSPDGLHMNRTGKMLKWVAVKGYANDWAIYAHSAYNDYGFVARSGDKITMENNIRKVVPCDDGVFKKYRL